MKEKDFQGWVIDLFTRRGWTVKHAPVPMRAIGGGRFVPDRRGRGLPDLMLIHDDPPRLILAECKGHDGVISADQKQMLGLLRGVSDVVRDKFRPESSPLGIYVFQPGGESMIEAIAAGVPL